MLRNVVAVLLDGFHTFEFGVVCEVFGIDRQEDGLPPYDFAVVAGEPGPLRSNNGFTLQTEYGLERMRGADLIAVPAVTDRRLEGNAFPEEFLSALRDAVASGSRVLGVCSGAFVLGEAGLLDGRRCTVHWRHTRELARRFPAAKVDEDVLYVDDDPVYTSAGTAAGIDACLYLVRKEQGSRVANGIARRMVVPPHRDGGQAQYIDHPVPVPGEGALAGLLDWLRADLGRAISVAEMADRVHMSARTFARRFTQETGTTPQRWLTGQRILLAQQLLEETDDTVEAIATRCGFGSVTVFRHHFRAWRGTTPNAYRAAFQCPETSKASLNYMSSAAAPAGLLAVALIFGIINAVLKPIIHTLGCALYALTLGLAAAWWSVMTGEGADGNFEPLDWNVDRLPALVAEFPSQSGVSPS
jgi:transcriptional regulator GlxA family with amidase domain